MQFGDRVAAGLRGFGPLGTLAILVVFAGNLVIVPLSAILVLLWAQRSDTPLSEIRFVRPRSWVRTVFVGLAFGITLKLVLKIIVMPLLGAEPINQTYQYIVGNRSALPGKFYAIIIGAGFGEETLFRGFMFERLGKSFGCGARAKPLIVLLTLDCLAWPITLSKGSLECSRLRSSGLCSEPPSQSPAAFSC